MAERSKKAAAEHRRVHGGQSAEAELRVLFLACGLGMVDDAEEAARLVCLPLAGAELAELEKRARGASYERYRTMHPSALAKLLAFAQFINALIMLRDVQKLSPAARALAGHMLQKAIDALGGHKLSWPVVNVFYTVEETK